MPGPRRKPRSPLDSLPYLAKDFDPEDGEGVFSDRMPGFRTDLMQTTLPFSVTANLAAMIAKTDATD